MISVLFAVKAYSLWWSKLLKELDSYHRGLGISVLEQLRCLPGELSLRDCKQHCLFVLSVLTNNNEIYSPSWLKKLCKKAYVWNQLFDSLLSRFCNWGEVYQI